MKKVEDIRLVYMNQDEIIKTVKRLDGNRCNAKSVNEAIQQGFTPIDYNRFLNRQKLIRKGFENLGCWDISSPLRLGKCNNEYYIIDGQGRLATWMKLENEYLTKGKGHFQKEIPVLIDERNMTKEKLEEITKVLNTTGTKWNGTDSFHSEATNNPEIEEVYKYFNAIRMKDKLITDNGIKLFLVGKYRSKIKMLIKSNLIFPDNETLLYDMYKEIADACASKNWQPTHMKYFYRFLTTNAIYLYYIKTFTYVDRGGKTDEEVKEEIYTLIQVIQERLLNVIPKLPKSELDCIFTGNYKTVIRELNEYLVKGLRKDHPLRSYFNYVDTYEK